MSKVIGYGSISAIILILCSIVSFMLLCLGYGNEVAALWFSGALFLIGCGLLLYILLVLAGFKREIPMPLNKTPQEGSAKRERERLAGRMLEATS